jgi:hypothetical protein
VPESSLASRTGPYFWCLKGGQVVNCRIQLLAKHECAGESAGANSSVEIDESRACISTWHSLATWGNAVTMRAVMPVICAAGSTTWQHQQPHLRHHSQAAAATASVPSSHRMEPRAVADTEIIRTATAAVAEQFAAMTAIANMNRRYSSERLTDCLRLMPHRKYKPRRPKSC